MSDLFIDDEDDDDDDDDDDYFTYDVELLALTPPILGQTPRGSTQMLLPKLVLERMSVLPAQIKAENTSENLLNEIRQIVYSLHWEYHKKYRQ